LAGQRRSRRVSVAAVIVVAESRIRKPFRRLAVWPALSQTNR
jgi:hypothetical protein